MDLKRPPEDPASFICNPVKISGILLLSPESPPSFHRGFNQKEEQRGRTFPYPLPPPHAVINSDNPARRGVGMLGGGPAQF